MSRPFRCSERPTAMKPTASTTIAMIAQITMGAVSQIGGSFLPFSSLEDAVRDDVRFLRSSPLTPKDVLIKGFRSN